MKLEEIKELEQRLTQANALVSKMNSITDLVSNLQKGEVRFITFDLRTKQFRIQNTTERTFTNTDLYNSLFGAIIDALQKQIDLWKKDLSEL